MLVMDTTSEGSIRRQCYIWFADRPFRPSGYDTVVFKEASFEISNDTYTPQPFPTLFSDLRLSEEELWNKLHKGKNKDIRLARNRGWSFRRVREPADIETFHALQSKFAETKGYPPPYSLPVLLRNAENSLFVFGDDQDGQTVCWINYALDERIARPLFTGYDLDYNKAARGYGATLMTWDTILYFKKQGFEIYDFGGAQEDPKAPGYSITKFKLGFGGVFEHRFDYVCRYPLSRPKRLWRQLALRPKRFFATG